MSSEIRFFSIVKSSVSELREDGTDVELSNWEHCNSDSATFSINCKTPF